MRLKTGADQLPKGWPTGSDTWLFSLCTCNKRTSVLVCAELQYTNSQIWFIRFDVDQSSKLVCVGNQAGEVFVWMLSGTEFVQVLFSSLMLNPAPSHRAPHTRASYAGQRMQQQEISCVCAADSVGGFRCLSTSCQCWFPWKNFTQLHRLQVI
jgi:hypothetical protein